MNIYNQLHSSRFFRIFCPDKKYLYSTCVKELAISYFEKFNKTINRELIECPATDKNLNLINKKGEPIKSIDGMIYVNCFADKNSYRNHASDKTHDHENWELDQLDIQCEITLQSCILDGALRLGEQGKQKEIQKKLKDLNIKLIDLRKNKKPVLITINNSIDPAKIKSKITDARLTPERCN